jgi:hypothetical protein
VRASLFDYTVRGALSPPHTSRALGSATQGHARDRDLSLILRAAQGNPQDKRPFRQTYSGRSARVATRPESQAAPPHIFNLPTRLSPPSHSSADRRLRPVGGSCTTRNLGIYCPAGSTLPIQCIAGFYCPNTQTQTACT